MRRDSRGIFLVALLIAVLGLWFSAPPQPSRETSAKGLAHVRDPATATAPSFNPATTTSYVPPTILPPASTSPLASGVDGQISASALRQISALQAEKSLRTPAQQKIDSQLLYADRMRRGVLVAEGVPTQRVDLDNDDQGRVFVDIKAEISPSLLDSIATLGGTVLNSHPQYHALRAAMPLAAVEALAARAEVAFVEPAIRLLRNSVDSQGDFAHQASASRTVFGVNGTNVNVGVLSDSVDHLTNSQIAGLVTVLSGQSGSPATGEGTAMLEIVHDLAPGAQLFFATGAGGTANFAANIQLLRAAGCGIIVDDLTYANESPFQDALVAQAVNTVTAGGALYFSSAGDSANKDHGFSGTWEGDFADGGQALAFGDTGRIHNFGGQNFDTVLSGTGALRLDFFWSDPLGASANDYDVFVLNSTGANVVASSTNPQTGTQDPYESVSSLINGELIVIVQHSGAGRFLHLETGRGRLSLKTAGNIRGHSCATNAFSIAAVDAAYAGGGTNGFAGGGQDPVELFSSDGPRRVFYQASGSPITPGNFSSTGGALRQKPDLAAADGVSTDVIGIGLNSAFYGTSASAPHAAAIAALVQSYNPSLTPAQIRTLLTTTALDIEAAGVDRNSGYGLVMASTALQAAPQPPRVLHGKASSNQFVISFTGVQGRSYFVERTTNLVSNTWTPLTNLTASNANVSLSDTVTNAQQFYRLRFTSP